MAVTSLWNWVLMWPEGGFAVWWDLMWLQTKSTMSVSARSCMGTQWYDVAMITFMNTNMTFNRSSFRRSNLNRERKSVQLQIKTYTLFGSIGGDIFMVLGGC